MGKYSHTEERSRTLEVIPIKAGLRQDSSNTEILVVMCGYGMLVAGPIDLLTKALTAWVSVPGWVSRDHVFATLISSDPVM